MLVSVLVIGKVGASDNNGQHAIVREPLPVFEVQEGLRDEGPGVALSWPEWTADEPLLQLAGPSSEPEGLTNDLRPDSPGATDLASLVALYPWPFADAWAVAGCESDHGNDPRTYDVQAENGGPFQINKRTWRWFFEANYGWSWWQVVTDDATNVAAAFVIYERNGSRFGGQWSCAAVVGAQ